MGANVLNCESTLLSYFLFVCVIGNCTDYTGAYICTCDPGYSGQNCSVDIDECESSPCINGGQLLSFLYYIFQTFKLLSPSEVVMYFICLTHPGCGGSLQD